MGPNYPSLEMTPFSGRQVRSLPEEEAESGPPNLRMAEDAGSCAECQHFDGDGECLKYGNAPVDELQVCDGFMPAGE